MAGSSVNLLKNVTSDLDALVLKVLTASESANSQRCNKHIMNKHKLCVLIYYHILRYSTRLYLLSTPDLVVDSNQVKPQIALGLMRYVLLDL